MKRDYWIVTEYAVRPNGNANECFYCHRKLGEEHTEDCVIRSRTVVVDFTIRTFLDVPEFCSEDGINFKYNHGTWCADNLLYELSDRKEKTRRCICDITSAKYIREASNKDEQEYGITFVNTLET